MNKIKVPIIAITPEIDEDIDYNHFPISENLTDIEDIDDEDQKSNRKLLKKRKQKLMIRLVQNDDGNTDIEDCEASDNEFEPQIVKHKKPLSLDNIDLDTGIYEETFKVKGENKRGRKKLLTQHSVIQSSKLDDSSSKPLKEVHTDVEDFDTDCEINENEIPEIEIDANLFQTIDNTMIKENFQSKKSPNLTPSPTDFDGDKNRKRNSLYLNIGMQKINNYTDCEFLDTDSDDSYRKKTKKMRKRRPKGYLRNRGGVTDIEDVELSSEERAKGLILLTPKAKNAPSSSKKMPLKYLQNKSSQLYDSDNEEDELYTKNKKPKQKMLLALPNTGNDGLTDVENFDSDDALSEISMYNYGEDELNKSIELLEDTCGIVSEEYSMRNNSNGFNYEQSNEDLFKIGAHKRGGNVKVTFSPREKKRLKVKRLKSITLESNLLCPDDGVTDIESIYSSQDEAEAKKYTPTSNNDDGNLTEFEEFSDVESCNNSPLNTCEIQLPPPTRDMVILHENQSGKPMVAILPLEDDICFGLTKYNLDAIDSDMELSSEEELSNLFRCPTPMLPILEGGTINVSEGISIKRSAISMNEVLTDTESMTLQSTNPSPRKYFLNIQNKTDIEDLFESDKERPISRNSIYSLTSVGNIDILTDVENISDDGYLKEVEQFRARSNTPIHMKEMSGETIFVKEGNGPFTQEDRLKVNRTIPKPTSYKTTPMYTDSEDMVVSNDEEINIPEIVIPIDISRELETMMYSKVHSHNTKKINLDAPEEMLYSKRGSIRDNVTDIEDMTVSDEETPSHDIVITIKKSKSSVSLNWNDCSVSFGFRDVKGTKVTKRVVCFEIQDNTPQFFCMLYLPFLYNVEFHLKTTWKSECTLTIKKMSKRIWKYVKFFEDNSNHKKTFSGNLFETFSGRKV